MKINLKNNEKFEKFYNFLVQENEKFNLTAITEKSEVYEKHFSDSIASIDEITSGANIIDVGAGAGFPSIPLAILKPDCKFTLIDSLNKRINFLNELKNLLSLQNVECFHTRIEDFAQKNREKYDFCIARAVAPLPTLLEYTAPFVKVNGKVIAYKGLNFEEELDNSKNAINKLNLELEKTVKYTLENCGQKRVLLIFTKKGKTPSIYPRKNNKPRTNPI